MLINFRALGRLPLGWRCPSLLVMRTAYHLSPWLQTAARRQDLLIGLCSSQLTPVQLTPGSSVFHPHHDTITTRMLSSEWSRISAPKNIPGNFVFSLFFFFFLESVKLVLVWSVIVKWVPCLSHLRSELNHTTFFAYIWRKIIHRGSRNVILCRWQCFLMSFSVAHISLQSS